MEDFSWGSLITEELVEKELISSPTVPSIRASSGKTKPALKTEGFSLMNSLTREVSRITNFTGKLLKEERITDLKEFFFMGRRKKVSWCGMRRTESTSTMELLTIRTSSMAKVRIYWFRGSSGAKGKIRGAIHKWLKRWIVCHILLSKRNEIRRIILQRIPFRIRDCVQQWRCHCL